LFLVHYGLVLCVIGIIYRIAGLPDCRLPPAAAAARRRREAIAMALALQAVVGCVCLMRLLDFGLRTELLATSLLAPRRAVACFILLQAASTKA
jgi:hypothetical protein